jgi:hypothetical protein
MSALAKHEDTQQHNLIPASDAPMVSMIERIAMDSTIPIDRLEKMLEMKERMEDRARAFAKEEREWSAKKSYNEAMAACQLELPVVVKNKKNTHTNSIYADLAALEQQAMPIIHKHGFGVSFQPDGYNDKGELRLLWEIAHSAGHTKNGVGEIPVDGAGSQGKVNKTGTQAFGSTATYGRRYLLCMLFNISTGDDRDGNRVEEKPVEFITVDQINEIRELIEEVGADLEKFLAVGKISSLSEIRSVDFNDAVSMLKRKGSRA